MGRAAGVPPTNVVDCCIVSPHRAGNTCRLRSDCALGDGQGSDFPGQACRDRDLPGGVWNGLIILDEHVESVDIVAALVGAWVYPEVVELCPDKACGVAASECVRWTWVQVGLRVETIQQSGLLIDGNEPRGIWMVERDQIELARSHRVSVPWIEVRVG